MGMTVDGGWGTRPHEGRGVFTVGLDLGQRADFTAICVLETHEDGGGVVRHEVRHLERIRDRPYQDITRRMVALLRYDGPLADAALVVDATGVGAAVVDQLRALDLRPVAVTIHGGDRVSREGDAYRVPKRDLVASVQVPLQNGALKVAAGLALAGTLKEELLTFKVKIDPATAHDSYSAWREGQHARKVTCRTRSPRART